jgi:hypothetical protein
LVSTGVYRKHKVVREMAGSVKLDSVGWREKTYNKILFVRKHDIHCVDIISAIRLVYDEFVFLEWNKK